MLALHGAESGTWLQRFHTEATFSNAPGMVRRLLALLAAGPLGAGLLATPAVADAASCERPAQGRFAVMAMGTQQQGGRANPQAQLLEERWLAGGVVQGTLLERVGQTLRRSSYRGSVTRLGNCLVRVERQLPWGRQTSEAVLDGRGRPLYSLDRQSGSVVTGRWLPMAPGSCRAGDLNGVVLSSQVGVNWQGGGWSPNAVVQREQWRDGRVQGIALSSYDGVGDTASYRGSLQMDANSCWGTLVENDAKGVNYNYRALVVNGRRGARGYLYLQTDPTDLTVGWLVRD